jgi:excinuclease ABC subunit B
MRQAIDETSRRRAMQLNYNLTHQITPRSILKGIQEPLVRVCEADYAGVPETKPGTQSGKLGFRNPKDLSNELKRLKARMLKAARQLEFEEAARLKAEIQTLSDTFLLEGSSHRRS